MPTRSQQFAIGLMMIIVGAFIGSLVSYSAFIVGWVAVLWLIIALSGQKQPFELIATIVFGLTLGIFIWQVTGGESWLHLGFIDQLSSNLFQLRNWLTDKIFLALPEPHGSLLSGILLGNKIKLDQNLIETFRTVGLTHIIAVSGYNLTVLTSNTISIFSPLIGRRSVWLALALIVAFILITGAPASILRAGVMASTILIARLVGRPSRSTHILIFATSLLVLFEPKIIIDIGFQLSVAATYGLIRLAPYMNNIFSKTLLPKTISLILGETLSAIILTAPLIIGHFERLSIVSPISNILVLPLIPLTMAVGLIGSVFMILPIIGNTIVLASWPLLTWVIFISEKLASWQFASTDLTLPTWVIVGFMAVIVGGLEYLNWKRPLTTSIFDRLAVQKDDSE